MRRRAFITLLGGAAAAWPLAARAQQTAMPVIGFLSSRSSSEEVSLIPALHSGLKETGYVEGRNVAIEYRWAEEQYDRLPALASELVHRQVAVIVSTGGVPGARAAKAATAAIPIVFITGVDPVAFGLVASLNRPGGNVTGVTSLSDEVAPKRLQLLHELVPTATAFALLVNPTNPNSEAQSRDMQAAAGALGVKLHVLQASSRDGFDSVFATAAELRAGGLVIGPDTFFLTRRPSTELAVLAARYAIPTISATTDFTAAGGLMSYGSSVTDNWRLAGVYAGRILKGQKPADLPVQQSTKVDFIINLKTAKALGISIPPGVLAIADKVVE